ncbi:MAG: sigma-70 family RNA polymerase sigma factor [Vicinamibacterales bacterium]
MSDAPAPTPGQVTEILQRASAGDRQALDALFPLVYQELRRIARRQRAGQPPGRTMTTTVLIHEVYLRLIDQTQAKFEDRVRFYAYAARVMRTVLVDEARARGARKRGGGWTAVELDERHLAVQDQADLVLAIDEALTRLADEDAHLARLVECRFFGGMTDEEVARDLGVSDRTVRRDWLKARTWLYAQLAAADPS